MVAIKFIKDQTLSDQVAIAEYNAHQLAVSATPVGTGFKLTKGEWYYDPQTKNIFEYEETKGGWKNGTVVFDLDFDSANSQDGLENFRASPGDEYHWKQTKTQDYCSVCQELFEKHLLNEFSKIVAPSPSPMKKTFTQCFPHLTLALRASDMKCQSLKSKANKAYLPSRTPSREDLIQSLLVTAAHRHAHNESNVGLSALIKLVSVSARKHIEADSACEMEWQTLVQTFVTSLEDRESAQHDESKAAATSPDTVDAFTPFQCNTAVVPQDPPKATPSRQNLQRKFDDAAGDQEPSTGAGTFVAVLGAVGAMALAAFSQ